MKLMDFALKTLNNALSQFNHNVTNKPRKVIINKVELSDEELRALDRSHYFKSGQYWYDATSGAWGFQGGCGMGYLPANLPLGPLSPDCSNGSSHIFINGRELPFLEVMGLQQIFGLIYPGRYTLKPNGDYGVENGAILGNVYAHAQQRAALNAHSSSNFYSSSATGAAMGSDGESFYINFGR